MTAGVSRAAMTITPQPALAPSPQPRPAPTERALIAQNAEKGGPFWMPIRGPDRPLIDIPRLFKILENVADHLLFRTCCIVVFFFVICSLDPESEGLGHAEFHWLDSQSPRRSIALVVAMKLAKQRDQNSPFPIASKRRCQRGQAGRLRCATASFATSVEGHGRLSRSTLAFL